MTFKNRLVLTSGIITQILIFSCTVNCTGELCGRLIVVTCGCEYELPSNETRLRDLYFWVLLPVPCHQVACFYDNTGARNWGWETLLDGCVC